MWLKDKHCIFIHIPKTAGTSIECALEGHGAVGLNSVVNEFPLQHLTAVAVKKRLGAETFDSCFKFAFVRNPFDRCVSEYLWARKHAGLRLGFDRWVDTKLRGWANPRRRRSRLMLKMHNIPQHHFIENAAGECMVDFVGRFETLDEDFKYVCSKLDLDGVKLSHVNAGLEKKKRDAGGYRPYYNKRSRNTVTELYKKDLEKFGYSF